MPATSEKQKRFMDAAAHNPDFARQAGVTQDVAKDFSESSKGLKFGKSRSAVRADRQVVNNPKTNQGKGELFKKGGVTMASKMDPKMMAMMAKKKGSMAPPAPAAPMAPAGMKKGGVINSNTRKGENTKIQKSGLTEGKQIVMSGNKGMKKGGKVC